MSLDDDVGETELIRRAQLLDDASAFSRLVKLHQTAVRTFLIRLCRDYHQANDLAQEAFIRAYLKLNQYRPVGTFQSWLLKIAFRCFLQYKRQTVRREHLERTHFSETIREEWYNSISPEQLALERAMQSLSPDEVACISLCYTFGHSHSEAAEILRLPLGTVKSHIKRGMAKMADMLAPTARERSS